PAPATQPAQAATVNPPPAAPPPPPPAPLEASITNSIKMKLVLIRPGKFFMGDDKLADAPRHEVTLTRPFYLGQYEVTEGERKAVLGARAPDDNRPAELPAAPLTWEEATEFCKRLSNLPEE